MPGTKRLTHACVFGEEFNCNPAIIIIMLQNPTAFSQKQKQMQTHTEKAACKIQQA